MAFLTVLTYHLRSSMVPGAGYVGVDLFFGLSGFLITVLIVQERRGTGRVRVKRFLARRAVRLLPALGTFLAVYVTAAAVFGGQPWFAGIPGRIGPARPLPITGALHAAAGVASYLYNLAIAYHWRWAEGAPVGHLWTLSVEVQFYVVWGVLLAGLLWLGSRPWREPRRQRLRRFMPSRRARLQWPIRRSRPRLALTAATRHCRPAIVDASDVDGPATGTQARRSAAEGRPAGRRPALALPVLASVVLAATSVVVTYEVWGHPGGSHFAYFSTWTRAQGLLLGAAAGLLWTSGRLQRSFATPSGRLAGSVLAIAAAGWLVAAFWVAPLGRVPGPAAEATAGMSAACAIVVALAAARPGGALARVLRARWLRYVGRRSYALYLWHYPLLAWFRGDGALGDAVAVGVAFAVAELSWRLVERPASRLRARLAEPPARAGGSAGPGSADASAVRPVRA